MKKIIWIGHPYFSGQLANTGWETIHIEPFIDFKILSWQDIINRAGFTPDVLVVSDFSSPPFVLGIENFPCLTVFYSIDSHIHSWHGLYAQGFDAALVSLADHIYMFEEQRLPSSHIWWSPPYAADDAIPLEGVEKKWDCLFVGTVNKELMPKRVQFLESVKKEIPGLEIQRGNYRTLFPQSKVLINHAAAGDLNFRVFEAMATKGCLVTPHIGHRMNTLFADGEHLVTYIPENAKNAAGKIRFLLEHPEIAEHIRINAADEINKKHRPLHRAQSFRNNLFNLAANGIESIIKSRMSMAQLIQQKYLSMPYLLWANELQNADEKKAFIAAANGKFGLCGL